MSITGTAVRAISEVLISNMTEHDLLEVVDLELRCGLSQWGWEAYYAELQVRNRKLMLVARLCGLPSNHRTGSIVGYIVARLIAGELHINNVAVHEDHRRRGIGAVLLKKILAKGEQLGGAVAFLEVRAGNLAAQALYEGRGFRVVGQRRKYYYDPVEDALVMSVQIRLNA